MKNLTPLRDTVFVSNLDRGMKKSKGGIIIQDDDMKERGIRERWAQVYAVGPQVTDLQIGEWVLVEHGRWTLGMDLELDDGSIVRVWRIEYPAAVLLVCDSDPRVQENFNF